jgi:integrase
MLNHRTMATFRKPDDYVFASKNGTRLNPDMLREGLQDVLRNKLGIRLGDRQDGLHLLRHTGGSMGYRARGVKAAQEALGHKSQRVTLEIYAHETEGSALQIPLEVFQRPIVAGQTDDKPN